MKYRFKFSVKHEIPIYFIFGGKKEHYCVQNKKIVIFTPENLSYSLLIYSLRYAKS